MEKNKITRKEMMEKLLGKVAEDKRAEFLKELREAQKEARKEIFEKYGVGLTEEEKELMKNRVSEELSDDELAKAAGGSGCGCYCYWSCASPSCSCASW